MDTCRNGLHTAGECVQLRTGCPHLPELRGPRGASADPLTVHVWIRHCMNARCPKIAAQCSSPVLSVFPRCCLPTHTTNRCSGTNQLPHWSRATDPPSLSPNPSPIHFGGRRDSLTLRLESGTVHFRLHFTLLFGGRLVDTEIASLTRCPWKKLTCKGRDARSPGLSLVKTNPSSAPRVSLSRGLIKLHSRRYSRRTID